MFGHFVFIVMQCGRWNVAGGMWQVECGKWNVAAELRETAIDGPGDHPFIAPDFFVSDSVFSGFALKPFYHVYLGDVHPLLFCFILC